MATVETLAPVSSLDRGVMRGADVKARLDAIIEIADHAMKPGIDYGKVPGTDKPSLWQAGADKLCVAFQIAPKIRVVQEIGVGDEKAYRVIVIGVHQATGIELGEGAGECSSAEEKYAFRYSVHQNEWDAASGDRRRLKFKRDGTSIQQIKTNPADVANTVLKMAVKRAKIAMVLAVTGAAAIFTQDVEDLADELRESLAHPDDPATPAKTPQRASATGAKPSPRPTGPKLPDNVQYLTGLVERVWRPKDKKFFCVKLKGSDRLYTNWFDKFEAVEKDAKAFEGTDHTVKLAIVETTGEKGTFYNIYGCAIADAEPTPVRMAGPVAEAPDGSSLLTADDVFGRQPGQEG